MEEKRTHKNQNEAEYDQLQRRIRRDIRWAKEGWMKNKCKDIEEKLQNRRKILLCMISDLKILHKRVCIGNKCESDIIRCQFEFREGFGTLEALFSLIVLLQ